MTLRGAPQKPIRIGIDFDNTIVTYDRVFHRHAVAQGLIPPDVPAAKKAIRDAIRRNPGGEESWTRLQGLVYGEMMPEAEIFPGLTHFLEECRHRRIEFSVISHKTVFPAIGPRTPLREVSREWLERKGFFTGLGLQADRLVFTDTKAEKLSAISAHRCTHFIDDLLEILNDPGFPAEVDPILFSPTGETVPPGRIRSFRSWEEIHGFFFG